ncbi:DNA translocase FtsK [Aquabacter cavernae]|uniref:DNA translocase FtsK n=1 Tax=Aquabacter cavernae TaxID=2496029 RepID=UPI000F8DA2B5|nr:DNA translocase FtsK [Aquabacter cavernae]
MDLIPESLRRALRRRSSQISGIAVLGASLFSLVSLMTWSATDPSLSNASNAGVQNLLGRPGAIVADLLMQLLGLASLAVLLSLAFWGWRLLTARPLRREKLRAGALAVGVLGLCAFLGTVPELPAWPIPAGLGGAIGDIAPRLIGAFRGGAATLFDSILVGAVGLAFALGGFYLALGRPSAGAPRDGEERAGSLYEPDSHEEDDEEEPGDRRAISLGALTHALLSAKARLLPRRKAKPARLAGLAREMFAEERTPDTRGRVEPGFAPAPASAVREAASRPVADDEDDDVPLAPPPKKAASRRAAAEPAPRGRPGVYQHPELTLLAAPQASKGPAMSQDALQDTAKLLEGTLEDFGVRGEILQVRPGPVVTLYELEPAPGIKSSRVIGLADDIARSMSAISARVAVVPGRNAIGIELPNPRREKVLLRELLATHDFSESGHKLAIALGKTIGGEPVIVDLARMPHLLVAGTTGSGKSVAINTMILSLLYRLKPEQCRLIMVDPKMLELSVYDGIPHLLAPVVTDPKKAVVALKWAVREMEDRYKKMSKLGVRNIDGFNARITEAQKRGESLARTVQTGFDHETGEAVYEREEMDLSPLPYIVVVVDEMADLMLVAGKDIEGAIQRLAQMARAAGIHLIMATQRPSVDVITGTIKANFPTRISFQVTSKIDSRTILGEQGAEQLLGQGDMLYMAGGGRISRVHGPFVSDDEVERIVRHLKAQGAPAYVEAVTADLEDGGDEDGAVFDKGSFGEEGQDLYSQAVAVVLRDRKCSTSYIQRRLQIGYNRAASLVERMEREGVVGSPNHAGKREILLTDEAAE